MKILHPINFDTFNRSSVQAIDRFHEMPPPLPWIEPGINMIYLEAVSSYVYGNDLGAILLTGGLLEHVLRLAILEKDKCGTKRQITTKTLDKLQSLRNCIDQNDGLIDDEDLDWWKNIANILRNKSAHLLIPKLYEIFNDKKGKYYAPSYYIPRDNANDFAIFFHRVGQYIAKNFIIDATQMLKKVISKTNWYSDESWWISQKYQYDEFFSYDWSLENMRISLDKYDK
ncbi:MAG: hypothetical protein IJE43_26360 [Alphaproteobacteria bacterium]|nr:hypothetical protein [Alphaproteobacteria bacterium]